MKKTYRLILCFIAIALNTASSQNPVKSDLEGELYAPEQLKDDLSLLRKALEEAHPNLYKYTPKASMDSSFNAINKALSTKMDILSFYRLLVPVFNKVKCGHTRIAPPESVISHLMQRGEIFPLNIKIINKRVFVTQNFSGDTRLGTGTEIQSINGLAIKKVLDKMLPATFADGHVMTMRYRLIEREFFFFYFLMLGEFKVFELEAVDPVTQQAFKTTVKAGQLKDRERRRVPLLDLTTFPEHAGTALLSVRSFDDRRYKASNINYAAFIDSAFAVLKKAGTKKLIIDIRGNDGGNPELVSHLYKHFADTAYSLLNFTEFKTNKRLDYFGDNIDSTDFYTFKQNANGGYVWTDKGNDWYGSYQPLQDNFKGKVYVLMDGGSFSSSGFLGTLIKHDGSAKIIGEEAGGGCSCNDCHGVITLPNSGLKANIARCYVTLKIAAPGCEGHGVIPDYATDQKKEDLLKEKDSVLEFALSIED